MEATNVEVTKLQRGFLYLAGDTSLQCLDWRPPMTRSVLMEAIRHDHRSSICSKPPKENIGQMQSVFAMFVFAAALLAPAGWIMHHIPDYKRRSPPEL